MDDDGEDRVPPPAVGHDAAARVASLSCGVQSGRRGCVKEMVPPPSRGGVQFGRPACAEGTMVQDIVREGTDIVAPPFARWTPLHRRAK